MLAIISPAKKLDFNTPSSTRLFSQPGYLDQSALLINALKELSVTDIATLMKISDKLAGLNLVRYSSWHVPFNLDNAKQAILAFKGDVYTSLNAETLNEDGLMFCQQHIRILSGLYGVLKPLDLIQPYRLEMGTRLKTSRGNNLYQFWGNTLTLAIESEPKLEDGVLVNLASHEYFKVLNMGKPNVRVITPVFKDWKNGHYKIISFYAKRARGLMGRYIIDNALNKPDDLKAFDSGGYQFQPQMSNGDEWVFIRRHHG